LTSCETLHRVSDDADHSCHEGLKYTMKDQCEKLLVRCRQSYWGLWCHVQLFILRLINIIKWLLYP